MQQVPFSYETISGCRSLTHFANAIDLSDNWPLHINDKDQMDVSGLLTWAQAYLRGAELLHFEASGDYQTAFYSGPVIQGIGLATELTLKTMLRGAGKTQKELREFRHNTYNAYIASRVSFDEVRFINLHLSNTAHLKVPDEVRGRLIEHGENDIETRWRVYFDHLRVLDTIYASPYKSRYVVPGSISLPNSEVILVGTKILLSAMSERITSTS